MSAYPFNNKKTYTDRTPKIFGSYQCYSGTNSKDILGIILIVYYTLADLSEIRRSVRRRSAARHFLLF